MSGDNGGPQVDVSKGYTIIHNDWANHPLVGVHTEYFRFWVDLLMNCSYKDGSIRTVSGHVYELRAGELVGAISYLANRWNVTPKRVRTFVDKAAQWRLVTVTKRGTTQGTARGTPAQTISINNYSELYDRYMGEGHAIGHASGPETGTPRARYTARLGHESNTINSTNSINSSTPKPPKGASPSNVQPITDWSTAFAQQEHGLMVDEHGAVQLSNGTRQVWLDRFGGDEKALDLAMVDAVSSIQPNSRLPKKMQIEKRLAQIAGTKHNMDRRYEKGRKAKTEDKQPGADFRAGMMQAFEKLKEQNQ